MVINGQLVRKSNPYVQQNGFTQSRFHLISLAMEQADGARDGVPNDAQTGLFLRGFQHQITATLVLNGRPQLCLLLNADGRGRVVFRTEFARLVRESTTNRAMEEASELIDEATIGVFRGNGYDDVTGLVCYCLMKIFGELPGFAQPGSTYGDDNRYFSLIELHIGYVCRGLVMKLLVYLFC